MWAQWLAPRVWRAYWPRDLHRKTQWKFWFVTDLNVSYLSPPVTSYSLCDEFIFMPSRHLRDL